MDESILGKKILVGFTYVDKKGNIYDQKQLHGIITEVTSNTIFFEQSDEKGVITIPNSGELELADSEAEYVLSSTKEKITGVHFLSSWTIHPPKYKFYYTVKNWLSNLFFKE